jgi:hypothetical protein
MHKRSSRLGLTAATGILALALAGLPVTADSGLFHGKAALADAGGNGKGHGNGNARGHGNGLNTGDDVQEAKAPPGKSKLAEDDEDTLTEDDEDSLHANELGRLNGFMHASPQALANASPNSAIGKISKEYRDALLGFTGTGEEAPDEAITEEELAGILAEAANKPLTGEQVIAIHEKLIANNPELADEAVASQLTDEDFAGQLADEANEIQATEANQGLGNSDEDEDAADDVADGDDSADDTDDSADEGDGVLADAADAAEAVGDAAVDTADAVGDFFSETF